MMVMIAMITFAFECYSMPDSVLRALHARSHAITQQSYEVVLS